MSAEKIFGTIPLTLILQALGNIQVINRINELLSQRLEFWEFPYTYIIAKHGGEAVLFDAIEKRIILSAPTLARIFNYLFGELKIQDARILIKRGIYETEEFSLNNDNIQIEGEGIGNTVIRFKYPGNNATFIQLKGNRIALRNLTIDWNEQNKSLYPNIGVGYPTLYLVSGSNHLIENVEVINGSNPPVQIGSISNLIINGMRTSGGVYPHSLGSGGHIQSNWIITNSIFSEGAYWQPIRNTNTIVINNILSFLNISPYASNATQDGFQDLILAFNNINGYINLRGRSGYNVVMFKGVSIIGNTINGSISIWDPNNNLANISDILIAFNILKGTGSGDGININYASKVRMIGNMIKNFATGINEVAGDKNYALLNDVEDNTTAITLTATTSKKLNNIGDDI